MDTKNLHQSNKTSGKINITDYSNLFKSTLDPEIDPHR